jgi:uncharacterized protein (TIGR00725 family)
MDSAYRYSICVSGAAGGASVEESEDLARRVGAAIARRGHLTVTGATVGLPYFAAQGAKQAGGMSIGYSPAATVREHLRKYRLPCNYFDYISYTGSHYMGRDLIMINSVDATVCVGGRLGTLNEFIMSVEQRKPVGVLLESGGSSDVISQLLDVLQPQFKNLVVFDSNPEYLIEKITNVLDEEYKDIKSELTVCIDWTVEESLKKSEKKSFKTHAG